MIDLLAAAAGAMDAQRAALDVCARNVAAAEAAGPNGSYGRLVPDFRIEDDGDGGALVHFAGSHEERGTNVDVITEMIAVMNASRAYESDASLFDVGKTLEERTIDMGRVS
ncbi:MAG TPA: flagellar basal body rod C-terminal domain-containing protein [Candidatus Baltobacteraceae bacterium]|nr:flagellar basal body rod C-terminal domain-containing protein [Candidatus Baltobacteraceae bacterium]